MCNAEIKERMRIQGVRQWQIAEYIGMNESLLYYVHMDIIMQSVSKINNKNNNFSKRFHT